MLSIFCFIRRGIWDKIRKLIEPGEKWIVMTGKDIGGLTVQSFLEENDLYLQVKESYSVGNMSCIEEQKSCLKESG